MSLRTLALAGLLLAAIGWWFSPHSPRIPEAPALAPGSDGACPLPGATDPGNGGGSNAGGDGQGDPGKTPDTSKPAASPKPAGTADDGQAAGAAPLASTGAGTGPAIAVAGLLAMAGASLLAAVARTRRHGADPDGLTAD